MKTLLLPLVAAATASVAFAAALPKLEKRWETPATLKVPESVLVDAARGLLYVSNIDGEPWADDGRGSVGKVGLDGQVLAVDWVSGLSAPKGMGLHGNRLYVADIDRIVVIDVDRGVIAEKVPVAGAHGLNDIAVAADGSVYVSDSKDKKIHRLKDGVVSLVIEGLKAVNGVTVVDGTLFFLDNGSLYRLGDKHEKVLVNAGPEGNGDGLELVRPAEFLITYWQGVIQFAAGDGSRHTLLDTSGEKISSADLGFDPERRVVYIPTFFKNSVVAYDLK